MPPFAGDMGGSQGQTQLARFGQTGLACGHHEPGMHMRLTIFAAGLGAATLLLTAAAPAPVADETTDKAQQMICRKEKETGSFVKVKKTCHTRAQWSYIDDENQRFSRQLVDDTRTRPGGN